MRTASWTNRALRWLLFVLLAASGGVAVGFMAHGSHPVRWMRK
jgi:hypothetical protein